MIAAAATLWSHGHCDIADAGDVASALAPVAGRFAEGVFAAGLLAASALGLGTVPLTSAYATAEALELERGLSRRVRDARGFYRLLTAFSAGAAALGVIPGLPLIKVMFLSQVFDGLLLPVVLVFVMLLARDRSLLGDLPSGRVASALGWTVTVLIAVLSVGLVATQAAGL